MEEVEGKRRHFLSQRRKTITCLVMKVIFSHNVARLESRASVLKLNGYTIRALTEKFYATADSAYVSLLLSQAALVGLFVSIVAVCAYPCSSTFQNPTQFFNYKPRINVI